MVRIKIDRHQRCTLCIKGLKMTPLCLLIRVLLRYFILCLSTHIINIKHHILQWFICLLIKFGNEEPRNNCFVFISFQINQCQIKLAQVPPCQPYSKYCSHMTGKHSTRIVICNKYFSQSIKRIWNQQLASIFIKQELNHECSHYITANTCVRRSILPISDSQRLETPNEPIIQKQLDSVSKTPSMKENAVTDKHPLQPESVKSQLTTAVTCEQNYEHQTLLRRKASQIMSSNSSHSITPWQTMQSS